MTISVIVCTRNRPERIQPCLEALLGMNLDTVCEILILDQSDASLDAVATPALDHPLVRYYWRKGRGLAIARNQAVRLAQGDILTFTDDDCIVTPDWADQISRAFAANPHIDGVLGRVLAYDDGSAPITCHTWRTDFGEIHYATRPGGYVCNALIDRPAAAAYNRPVMPVEHVGSGNNMAFRRTAFQRHGLFIEALGTGRPLGSGEDFEFHWRLMRDGSVLLYNPTMLVYHNGWLSAERNEALQHDYTRGVIAVCVAFAFYGDPLAWRYLRFRGKTASAEIVTTEKSPQERRPLQYYITRALAFGQGVRGGLLLALSYRRLIPQLD